MAEHRLRVQTWTLLGRGTRHVPMPSDDCPGEQPDQFAEQVGQPLRLRRCPRVRRTTLCVQPALVTDADAARVPRLAVRARFQQVPVLGHCPVAADVEMVTNGAEAAGLVVTHQLLHRIVAVAPRRTAMKNQEPYPAVGVHGRIVFRGPQRPLVRNQPAANDSGKSFIYHSVT